MTCNPAFSDYIFILYAIRFLMSAAAVSTAAAATMASATTAATTATSSTIAPTGRWSAARLRITPRWLAAGSRLLIATLLLLCIAAILLLTATLLIIILLLVSSLVVVRVTALLSLLIIVWSIAICICSASIVALSCSTIVWPIIAIIRYGTTAGRHFSVYRLSISPHCTAIHGIQILVTGTYEG